LFLIFFFFGMAYIHFKTKKCFSSLCSHPSSCQTPRSVPGTTQWVYFAALAGTGSLFLLLAFFVFLPMIILSPSKFAITFSLGSTCIIASLGALRGWRQMARAVVAKDRLPFTAAYVASLIATLYASLVMHSYLMSLLSCVAQIGALLYYLLSFFPGGTSGLSTVSSGALSLGGAAVRGIFGR
jgi:hypothetical protein